MDSPPPAAPTRTYADVPGWFDFEDFYREVAAAATAASVLIEVGCWRGRSIIFLAEELRRLQKRPALLAAIDTWAGSPGEWAMLETIDQLGGPDALYADFLGNLEACGVRDLIRPLRRPSVEAASLFPDASIDFCFIDGAHDYESVRADLVAWRSRMRPGGTLAGHDRQYETVWRAVTEVLGDSVSVQGTCWVHRC